MRSLLTTFTLLVWFLAAASALKGVRRTRLLQSPPPPKDKKCKKFAAPKADPKGLPDPKATGPEPTGVSGENEAGPLPPPAPKEDGEAGPLPPAPKEDGQVSGEAGPLPPPPKDPKAGPEAKATKEDPKAGGPEAKSAKAVADPKAGSIGVSEDLEPECLEWEEAGSRDDPMMTSTEFQSINVDCDAIANDKAAKDTHSVSYMVNIDIIKDADYSLQDIYKSMEKEMQYKVAPRIAGCSGTRMLAEDDSSTKIVNVDFGEMELDRKGCDSSLAKDAAELDGTCSSTDIPVDVYFVGNFPKNAIAKVEVAIEEHEWSVDGLLDTSEVVVVQTGSSMTSSDSGTNPGIYAAIGLGAAVLAGCVAFCMCRSKDDDTPVAKAELDTDEESDDEKNKSKVQTVAVTPVGRS